MLPNNGLVGSLQPSIGYLTALRILDLSANNLTSSLPSSLSTIPFLSTLYASCSLRRRRQNARECASES